MSYFCIQFLYFQSFSKYIVVWLLLSPVLWLWVLWLNPSSPPQKPKPQHLYPQTSLAGFPHLIGRLCLKIYEAMSGRPHHLHRSWLLCNLGTVGGKGKEENSEDTQRLPHDSVCVCVWISLSIDNVLANGSICVYSMGVCVYEGPHMKAIVCMVCGCMHMCVYTVWVCVSLRTNIGSLMRCGGRERADPNIN